MLVRGTVGDGPGLELLASLDRMDLPDPEVLLADPAAAVLPERGDLRQAVLDGVVEAVRKRPEQARWDAAWAMLARALETGAPDLVVVPATTLAALRRDDWDVPGAIERLAGAVSLSQRADRAGARVAAARRGRHDDRPPDAAALDVDKLFAARLHAARVRPYLATALFALHVVESRRVPTMAVDRHWRCYVSPAFVDRDPGGGARRGVGARGLAPAARPPRPRRPGRAGTRPDRPGGAAADEHRRRLRDQRRRVRRRAGPARRAPSSRRRWGSPTGELMEDYLRQFRLGPHTQGLAWLDCGSGADGLDREWDLGAGRRARAQRRRSATRSGSGWRRASPAGPGTRPKGWRRWAERGVPPAAAVAGPAGRGGPLGGRPAPGAGEDYTYGRPSRRSAEPARRRPAEPAAPAAPGLRHHRHVRVGERRRTGQRAAGGRRDRPGRGRPARPGHRAAVRRGGRGSRTRCAAPRSIPLIGGGGTDLRTGFARALRTHPAPGRHRGPDRRADALARRPAAVPDGGRAVPAHRPADDGRTPASTYPTAAGLGAGGHHRLDVRGNSSGAERLRRTCGDESLIRRHANARAGVPLSAEQPGTARRVGLASGVADTPLTSDGRPRDREHRDPATQEAAPPPPRRTAVAGGARRTPARAARRAGRDARRDGGPGRRLAAVPLRDRARLQGAVERDDRRGRRSAGRYARRADPCRRREPAPPAAVDRPDLLAPVTRSPPEPALAEATPRCTGTLVEDLVDQPVLQRGGRR